MAGVHPVIEQTHQVLASRLAGRSAAEVARYPGGDATRWCAQQIIEHLATTWRLTTQGLEDRLRKGRPVLTPMTMQQRIGQLAVCTLGHFPKGREAPAITLPSAPDPILDGDAMVARIHTTLAAMDAALDRMTPIANGKAALTHPVLGPMRIEQWRKFHRAHARHHAKQIHALLGDR